MVLLRYFRVKRTAARCGPRSTISGGGGGGDLLAAARIVLLDVPGVPAPRLVGVSPDLVAATGKRLAPGALVVDARRASRRRRDRPAGRRSRAGLPRPRGRLTDGRIDHHRGGETGDEPVAGDHAAARDGLPARQARRRHEAERPRRQVGIDDEHGRPGARRGELAGDRAELIVRDRLARGDDVVELVLGLLVDLTDAGAGKDVVELVAEHHAPVLLERRRDRRAEQRRHARQRLGRDQGALGPPMQVFRAALRGQRAAVELEIHLADPDRQVGIVLHLAVDLAIPLGDVDRPERRHDRKIGELALALEHLRGRPAAAVAIAEGEQALGIDRACRDSSARSRRWRARRSRHCSRRPGCRRCGRARGCRRGPPTRRGRTASCWSRTSSP